MRHNGRSITQAELRNESFVTWHCCCQLFISIKWPSVATGTSVGMPPEHQCNVSLFVVWQKGDCGVVAHRHCTHFIWSPRGLTNLATGRGVEVGKWTERYLLDGKQLLRCNYVIVGLWNKHKYIRPKFGPSDATMFVPACMVMKRSMLRHHATCSCHALISHVAHAKELVPGHKPQFCM